MNFIDLRQAMDSGQNIKHENMIDVLFAPLKIMDKTNEDVQIKGAWIRLASKEFISMDYITIKLKDLANWKVLK